jgi:ABC-type branched-subunit amino acid transport system ATPase component
MIALLETDGKQEFRRRANGTPLELRRLRWRNFWVSSGRTVSASQLVNLSNGVFTSEVGRIRFNGVDITGEPPYHIARRGLARTHQIVQPLNNMTVFENCMVSACFKRENLPLVRAGEAAWGAAVVTRASEHQSRQQHQRVG